MFTLFGLDERNLKIISKGVVSSNPVIGCKIAMNAAVVDPWDGNPHLHGN